MRTRIRSSQSGSVYKECFVQKWFNFRCKFAHFVSALSPKLSKTSSLSCCALTSRIIQVVLVYGIWWECEDSAEKGRKYRIEYLWHINCVSLEELAGDRWTDIQSSRHALFIETFSTCYVYIGIKAVLLAASGTLTGPYPLAVDIFLSDSTTFAHVYLEYFAHTRRWGSIFEKNGERWTVEF